MLKTNSNIFYIIQDRIRLILKSLKLARLETRNQLNYKVKSSSQTELTQLAVLYLISKIENITNSKENIPIWLIFN